MLVTVLVVFSFTGIVGTFIFVPLSFLTVKPWPHELARSPLEFSNQFTDCYVIER
jgi:hypothetical protein